jgi:fatty-acyl-CoA synthase
MFTRMLKLPEAVRNSYDISSLERVMHAAAPCPVEIKKQMIDWWGPIVDEYYASSEAIGSTLISAEEWLAHPGSVGKPMVGNVHILDEEATSCPRPGGRDLLRVQYELRVPQRRREDGRLKASHRLDDRR